MIELPLDPTEENYSISCSLDGQNYTFRFYWNARASSWFFDLERESDGLQLLSQTRVSVGAALIDQFVGFQGTTENEWPPGQLYVFDTSGADLDPGVKDLGARVKIFYLDASECVEEGIELRA
jgi:hypothetical protein